MLQRVMILVLVLIQLGCSRPAAQANRDFVGTWVLNTTRNCTYGRVTADELIFHTDGTFDQHLQLPDGRTFDSKSNRWSFVPEQHNISLDSRWNYTAEMATPVKESESLIVEFTKPPVILIDPDNNCFYQRVSD